MQSYRHSGFSLPELMIAMLIGLFLLAGVVQIFNANKQSFRLIETSSRQQETLRFSTKLMADQLRRVGYLGSNSTRLARITVLASSPPFIADGADRFTAADALDAVTFATETTSNRPYGISPSSINVPIDSDSFGFYRVEPGTCTTDAKLDASSSSIELVKPDPNDYTAHIAASSPDTDCNISAGTDSNPPYILVNDGTRAGVWQADGEVTGSSISVDNSGSATLPEGEFSRGTLDGTEIEVYELIGSIYYVACHDIDAHECSLYYDDNIDDGGSPQPLVPGVIDMRVLYGEDTDTNGSPNQFVSLADVGDLGDVVSMRIAFLTISDEDNVIDSPQEAFYFPPWSDASEDEITPSDRRIRRITTMTVTLRNRVDARNAGI